MLMKFMRYAFLLIVGASASLSASDKRGFNCDYGGDQNRGGRVHRAGALLLKSFRSKSKDPQDIGVLVLRSAFSHLHSKIQSNKQASQHPHPNSHKIKWNFPGGECEPKDRSVVNTAKREIYEEARQKIESKKLNHYVYSNRSINTNQPILLYVLDHKYSERDLHKRLMLEKKRHDKKHLKHQRKYCASCETDGAAVIPLKNLISAAKRLKQNILQHGGTIPGYGNWRYVVKSRGNGKGRHVEDIYIDRFYMTALAMDIDRFVNIVNKIYPKARF